MPRFGADFLSEVLSTAKTPIGQFMGEEGGGKIQGTIPGGGGFFPTTMPGFNSGGGGGSFGYTPIPSGGGGFGGGDHGFGAMMAAVREARTEAAQKAAAVAAAQAKKDKAARDAVAPPAARDDYRTNPGTTPTGNVPASVPAEYQGMIQEAATTYGVDPTLLAAQLRQESGFTPGRTSSAGAQGLAQFIPATARQYGVDVNDARSSILGMAHYMSDLLKQYGGNQQEALAAYNGGDRAVQRLRAGQPFGETRAYLSAVGTFQQAYQQETAQAAPQSDVLPEIPGQENGGAIRGVNQNDYARAAGLDRSTAAAICGPAAVDAFVRQNGGRTPSLTEAFDIASRNGFWSQSVGMYGPNATKAVIERMGVPAEIVPARTPTLAREVTLGRLAIVNTRGHYYQAIGYDPDTDRFQWGDAVGGGRWARLDQISNWGYGSPDVAIIAAPQ